MQVYVLLCLSVSGLEVKLRTRLDNSKVHSDITGLCCYKHASSNNFP